MRAAQSEGQKRVNEIRDKLRLNEFLSFHCEDIGRYIHLPTKALSEISDGHPLYFDEFKVYQDKHHVMSDIYDRVLQGESSTSELIHSRVSVESFYDARNFVLLLDDLLSLGYICEPWVTERMNAIVIER